MQQQALQQAFAEGKYASYTGQSQTNVSSLSPAEQAQYYAGIGAGKADGIANAEASVLGFAELGVGILGRFGLFVGKEAFSEAENLVTRGRVLDNIAESMVARESSNFPILPAKESQLLGGYSVDDWSMTMLKKGDVIYGGLPGQSSYYATLDSVLESGGSKEMLGQLLQISPHIKFGYRPNIGEYILTRDVQVPTSIVNANPHLGIGSGTQFFIEKNLNFLNLNNEYSLENFYELNMPGNQYRY